MSLSIREASRFVIGAAIMRTKAIEASNVAITIDNLATAAFREDADGEKLRHSIDILADGESGWLRNTPPHVLKTERVIEGREEEIRAFAAIHAATIATIEHASDASAGNTAAHQALHTAYMGAIEAIAANRGQISERRQLKALLHDQAQALTTEGEFVNSVLKEAESAYLTADFEATMAKYDQLDRSNDFDR